MESRLRQPTFPVTGMCPTDMPQCIALWWCQMRQLPVTGLAGLLVLAQAVVTPVKDTNERYSQSVRVLVAAAQQRYELHWSPYCLGLVGKGFAVVTHINIRVWYFTHTRFGLNTQQLSKSHSIVLGIAFILLISRGYSLKGTTQCATSKTLVEYMFL